MTLRQLALDISLWRANQGFATPASIEEDELMLGKLMLIVTEVSEAAEAVRDQDQDNFEEEIADTFIRLLDLCGTMGIDPEEIILRKMEVNRHRPPKHGRISSV